MLTDNDRRVIQQMDGESLDVLIWQLVYGYRCVPAEGVMRGATGFLVVDEGRNVVSSETYTAEAYGGPICQDSKSASFKVDYVSLLSLIFVSRLGSA